MKMMSTRKKRIKGRREKQQNPPPSLPLSLTLQECFALLPLPAAFSLAEN
jgi:hypothetical protein